VPNMDEITNQNDLYVTCALAAPRTKNKKLKTDVHLRAKNGLGNFNWRFVFPLTLPSKQSPRLKLAVWDMDFFSANDCIGEVVLSIRDLCKAALKNKNEAVKFNANALPPPPRSYAPQWAVNIAGKLSRKKEVPKPAEEHPSDRFWLYLPERNGKTGKIEVSVEILHKDTAALLPAGSGRSAPNTNPFLPEPEGRLNLSLFHPCNMIREILGDKCTGKMLSCCCCIALIALCVVMFPMIFSNVIGNLFTPKFGH